MSPRPILKRSGSSNAPDFHQLEHHHRHRHHAVHFPPSPALCRTFSAYSPSAYDRSPIQVSPNSCALPERGCPGRTYKLEEDHDPVSPQTRSAGSYGSAGASLHPRALAYALAQNRQSQPPADEDADRTPTRTAPSLPSLIPDTSSSESDESDGFISPPPESAYTYEPYHMHGLAIPAPRSAFTSYDPYVPSEMPHQSALSFLPYSPASPSSSQPQDYPPLDNDAQKPRRRRGERERKHESSRDPDRIPSGDAEAEPTSRQSSRISKCKSATAYKSLCGTMSSFAISDDGCLGGF